MSEQKDEIVIKTTFCLNDIAIKKADKTLMMRIGSHVACIEEITEIDKMILILTHIRNEIRSGHDISN